MNELRKKGAKTILLNFEKIDFISNSGLRVQLANLQEPKIAGGGPRVCSLNAEVEEVFNISGFSMLLNVFENEAMALPDF